MGLEQGIQFYLELNITAINETLNLLIKVSNNTRKMKQEIPLARATQHGTGCFFTRQHLGLSLTQSKSDDLLKNDI